MPGPDAADGKEVLSSLVLPEDIDRTKVLSPQGPLSYHLLCHRVGLANLVCPDRHRETGLTRWHS